MFVALSIGNSNLQLARFDGEDGVSFRSLPVTGDVAEDELDAAIGDAGCVAVASVRDDRLEPLLGRLRQGGRDVVVCGRDFDVPIVNRYDDPREVGVDRLLAVHAAQSIFPGETVIVVDFGTALTVNVGSPQGEFLGGLIAAGAAALREGLAARTPELPRVDRPREEPALSIARSTPDALRQGVFWQFVGGVERLLEGTLASCPGSPRVCATGGDAQVYAASIERIERVEPHLVLRGLASAFREAASGTR